jgi:hypothetical protein
MRVGWPKDLVQQGGSDCGCGSCPLMRGGGMPVPDACPFAGTGMCGFYARGGGCPCMSWLKKGGANNPLYHATTSSLNKNNPLYRGTSSSTTRSSLNELRTRLKKPTTPAPSLFGGKYKPTAKNLAALRKWRKGKSIGFTMKASLKAKGLIPRTSRKHRGKKIVSNKYK